MLIISAHTPDPLYTTEAERLRYSLARLGLRHKIYEMEPMEDWHGGTSGKVGVISKALFDHPFDAVMWIDADAYVHSNPWPMSSSYKRNTLRIRKRNDDWLTGTMVFSTEPDRLTIMQKWIGLPELCRYQQPIRVMGN